MKAWVMDVPRYELGILADALDQFLDNLDSRLDDMDQYPSLTIDEEVEYQQIAHEAFACERIIEEIWDELTYREYDELILTSEDLSDEDYDDFTDDQLDELFFEDAIWPWDEVVSENVFDEAFLRHGMS